MEQAFWLKVFALLLNAAASGETAGAGDKHNLYNFDI
jgi:hypothetical protein